MNIAVISRGLEDFAEHCKLQECEIIVRSDGVGYKGDNKYLFVHNEARMCSWRFSHVEITKGGFIKTLNQEFMNNLFAHL